MQEKDYIADALTNLLKSYKAYDEFEQFKNPLLVEDFQDALSNTKNFLNEFDLSNKE